MRHFQYRIRERVRYNGQKDYVVEWRDDWFGTGIFWLSRWIICRDAPFNLCRFGNIEKARAFLAERKEDNERFELERIAKERTVE